MINFFPSEHITSSCKRKFGICDYPGPSTTMAYIAEKQGEDWIAAVDNYNRIRVYFVPIDHCIELWRADGIMDNRCDGCLFYDETIIFVELKQRSPRGGNRQWIDMADKQLRSTIRHFEKEDVAANFSVKKAYIANSEKPKFISTRMERMDRFFTDTGYVLYIKNRIDIE